MALFQVGPNSIGCRKNNARGVIRQTGHNLKYFLLYNLHYSSCTIEGGPEKNGTIFDDNFAAVNGRKACYMSKVCKFV